MNKKIETLGRLVSLIIGIMGVVIGFAFGFSLGQINLIPIPDLRHANPLSGLVIGTICILTVIVEGGYFYREYLPAINHKKPFEKSQPFESSVLLSNKRCDSKQFKRGNN